MRTTWKGCCRGTVGFLLALALAAGAAAQDPEAGAPATVGFVSPEADAVVSENAVDVFVRAENHPLSPGGNALHLLLDNGSPEVVTDARVPVTFRNLSEGGHTLRLLAVRPDGTALANPEAFALVHFFVRRRDFQNYVDPAAPTLTVNLPRNSRGADAPLQGRVCFDFRAENAPLAKEGGYVVRCALNQDAQIVDTARPVYWEKLQPGRYELTAELLTSALQPVPGIYNRVSRTFEVQAPVKAMPVVPAAPVRVRPPPGVEAHD